jgi:DNA-3-methyladenine glycosylase
MQEFPILNSSFYQRKDVIQISKELLGKVLVTNIDGEYTSGIIVETEAYRAPDDKACHAYGNRRTKRTRTMFENGGISYVYVCYGIHHLFNVVTGEEGMAHAVLIRAVEPLDNIDLMAQRRSMKNTDYQLTSGPGKLSVALGIRSTHDALSLINRDGKIWIEDRNIEVSGNNMIAGPRVGMTSAEECAHWPWRFRINGNKWTSKPDIVKY